VAFKVMDREWPWIARWRAAALKGAMGICMAVLDVVHIAIAEADDGAGPESSNFTSGSAPITRTPAASTIRIQCGLTSLPSACSW